MQPESIRLWTAPNPKLKHRAHRAKHRGHRDDENVPNPRPLCGLCVRPLWSLCSKSEFGKTSGNESPAVLHNLLPHTGVEQQITKDKEPAYRAGERERERPN